MQNNSWARLLAYVSGLVNQRLLLQCEYLVAENQILRSHLPRNLRLSDSERCTLAEIGKRLGRKLLSEVACVAQPETILGWYRRLIARKFDGSNHSSYPGRPRVDRGAAARTSAASGAATPAGKSAAPGGGSPLRRKGMPELWGGNGCNRLRRE